MVRSGEPLAEAGYGLGPAPAMQQEEGSTGAVLIDGDLDRPDAIEIQRVRGGGHGVTAVPGIGSGSKGSLSGPAYVVEGTVA